MPSIDPREILKDIRDHNFQFYSDPLGSLGRGALKDLQQTFPNPWLYVAELLQNAIDEKASPNSRFTPGRRISPVRT
jgi:hypothetical protein